MAAINEPYVVLVGADVKFLAPVVVGDVVEFFAKVIKKEDKKGLVRVDAKVKEKEVFSGTFKTFALEKHILRN
jgi:acyl dehydratase